MTVFSLLTFVLVAFCSYTVIMSKPNRNESAKNVDLPQHEQQHQHQLQSEATHETRQKRSELNFGGSTDGEYKDFNELIDELEDNGIAPVSQEMGTESMPSLLYILLLNKLKQLQTNERQLTSRRTPRLGRSIDFQLFDGAAATTNTAAGRDFERALNMANDYAVSRQFLPRVLKKSAPYKPRLGKRTQVCDSY